MYVCIGVPSLNDLAVDETLNTTNQPWPYVLSSVQQVTPDHKHL